MTAVIDFSEKRCSACCSFAESLETDGGVSLGLYECTFSDSDHYGHAFTDSHPICDDAGIDREDNNAH